MGKKLLSIIPVIMMLLSIMGAPDGAAVAKAVEPAKITHLSDDGARDIDFNENWQFFLATRTPSVAGGSGADGFRDYGLADAGGVTTAEVIRPGFDDSSWRTLTVPHDFSIEGEKVSGGSDSQGFLQGGLGWYRKTFTVPKSMPEAGKRITIDFEGVYQNAIVYLNGRQIGNYPSGYTGFAYDLTDLLNYGDKNPNVLVVKVQNMSPSGRWYTGSGIIRPVRLIVTNPVRLVRNGLKLTAPTLETTYKADGSAELLVNAGVFSNAPGRLKLKTSVIDAKGNIVARQITSAAVTITPNRLVTLTDQVNVPKVKLWFPWNIGAPCLYTVRSELVYEAKGGRRAEAVDAVDTPFGFRWFEMDESNSLDGTSEGLYVNDVYTKIQGVDLHHDSGALGAVSHRDAYERQFAILKRMGVNAYRTSHCPPSKAVISLCSQMGIMVVEEAYDGWGAAKADYDFGNFFLQPVPHTWAGLYPNGFLSLPAPSTDYEGAQYLWSEWVIQEMVNRDYNEAAIMMWSIGNEVRGVGQRPSWYDGSRYDALGHGISSSTFNEYTEAVRLTRAIKALDSSRWVVMGGDQQRSVPGDTSVWAYIDQYLDGYGLNYNTATSVDGLMNRFPATFFFESESSSQTSSRGVYYDPSLTNTGINRTPGKRGGSNYDNDFESWTMSNEYGLKKDRDRKAFTGQFIWSGFDYLGEPTPYYSVYPVGVSSFGCIDTAGFPKDSYYLYQSQWMDKTTAPMVHILPTNWNDWREGEIVEVWVNTNVRTAELFLNGKSLGTKSFDVKRTAYGKEYYETSEAIADDKTWPAGQNAGNTDGYASPGALVVNAGGDSQIAGGSTYGRLHLAWYVPYEPGLLEVKAYTDASKTQWVAADSVATSGWPYTVKMATSKKVIKADGTSLAYVECTVVDKNGHIVSNADNLFKFEVTGGAIVGVDNGRQESAELYKWGNVERNTHSECSAYMGKVLVILQSNKDEAGDITLTVRSGRMKPAQIKIAATATGMGHAPGPVASNGQFISYEEIQVAVPAGIIPTLPRVVAANYSDSATGRYSIMENVVWNEITAQDVATPRVLTVTGTVEGGPIQTVAKVYVTPVTDISDIALNTALGDHSGITSFAQVPPESAIRNGALATTSFSGSSTTYPNNMLNGNPLNYWSNAYSRGASVLLSAISASKPYEYVEFFWDGPRVFNEVKLYFTTGSDLAIPGTLTVRYWDGGSWVAAGNQAVQKATASNAATTITFAPVTAGRVRVDLKNATPYATTGHMRIEQVNVMGWNPGVPGT